MQVSVFDNSLKLWQAAGSAWQSGSRLVIAHPGSRERFLWANETSTWQENLLTERELWMKLSKETGDIKEASPRRITTWLSSELNTNKYPYLGILRDRSQALESLVNTLKRYERDQLDQDPKTQAPENELHELYQAMLKAGMRTDEGQRWVEANSDLQKLAGYNWVFTPALPPTPQLLHLWQRMSELLDTTVSIYVLAADIHPIQNSFPPNTNFIDLTTNYQPDLIKTFGSRDYSVAIRAISKWISDGTPASKIGIFVPSQEQIFSLGQELANEGIASFWETSVDASASDITAKITSIAKTPDGGVNDFPELACQTGNEWLLKLSDYAFNLAVENTNPITWLWLESLRSLAEELKAENINYVFSLAHARHLVTVLLTPRTVFGQPNGVIVADYNSASEWVLEKAIVLGLQDGSWPKELERSPFLSSERSPVRDKEPSTQLSQLFATAKQTLIVGNNLHGDWAAPLAIYTPQQIPHVSFPLTTRASLRKQAQDGNQSAKVVRQIAAEVEAAEQWQHLKGFKGKDYFSVTELETWLRCPRGWFVSYILSPPTAANAKAQWGIYMHDALEKLANISPDKRSEWVENEWPALALECSNDQLMAGKMQLNAILEKYFDLPWPKIMVEQTLRSKNIFPGITLIGKADRIDYNDEEALIIDYKARRSVRKPTRDERDKQLQPYLYPLMVEEQYGLKPLGMLYVSLAHSAHIGTLTRYIQGLDSDAVNYNWQTEKEAALLQAELAIKGIKSGDWMRRGKNCADWCSCHLLPAHNEVGNG